MGCQFLSVSCLHKTFPIAFVDGLVSNFMGFDTSKYCKTSSLQKVYFNFWNDFLAFKIKNKTVLGWNKIDVLFFVGLEDLKPRPV